jgi:hypothetical protein
MSPTCHCEERSDAAISRPGGLNCLGAADIAMPGEVSDFGWCKPAQTQRSHEAIYQVGVPR